MFIGDRLAFPSDNLKLVNEVVLAILAMTGALVPFVYLISRILLLALSLSTLRSLPPSAYPTVQWTTFLPHV
jgi:hypothetical protein